MFLVKNMFEVVTFDEQFETAWDNFVEEKAVNGTFLQTRRFLNYHPMGRFQDASCLIFDDKKHLVAVCPACVRMIDDKKVVYSHAGSSYGGILIDRKWYKAGKVIEMIQALENYLGENGYDRIIVKQTPSLFAAESADLLQYCFFYLGYHSYSELNLYVDLEKYNENILSEFSQGKRTDVHNCQKRGLYVRKLTSFSEIVQLHGLLGKTLKKYNIEPIHTAEELYDFQTARLQDECECFGVFEKEKMAAGSMMFYFKKVGVAHTQYLCADPAYSRLSPMTYLYYAMLVEMRKRGYQKVSWGAGTEKMGLYINEGLVKSKEYYGSKYSINPIFIKDLCR